MIKRVKQYFIIRREYRKIKHNNIPSLQSHYDSLIDNIFKFPGAWDTIQDVFQYRHIDRETFAKLCEYITKKEKRDRT